MDHTEAFKLAFQTEVDNLRLIAPPGVLRAVTPGTCRLVLGDSPWKRVQLKLEYPPSFGSDKGSKVQSHVEAPQLADALVSKMQSVCDKKVNGTDVGGQAAAVLEALKEMVGSRLMYCWPEIRLIKALVKANAPSEMKASEKTGTVRLSLKVGNYSLGVQLSVPDIYPEVPAAVKVLKKQTTFPEELVLPFVAQANDAARRCAAGVDPEKALGASNPVRLPGKVKREEAEAAVAKVTAASLRGLKHDLAFYRRTAELHRITDSKRKGDARSHANCAAERKAARKELKRAIKRELEAEEAAVLAAEAELRKKAVEEAGALAAAVEASTQLPSSGSGSSSRSGAAAGGGTRPGGDSDEDDSDDDASDDARLAIAEAFMTRVDGPLTKAQPSLWVAVHVLACRFALFLPRARCTLSHRRLIPRDPAVLHKVMASSGSKKESPRVPVRAFCGHWFHLAPLDEMMKRPPWPSMCPRPGCEARLLHRRWPVDTSGMEKRWARKEEKIREREDVADALDLIGLGGDTTESDEEGEDGAAAGGGHKAREQASRSKDGYDLLLEHLSEQSPAVGRVVKSVGEWPYRAKGDDEGDDLSFEEDASKAAKVDV